MMRYTSHLDLHKTWERTFRRAKLPLAYSQGFHPQPRISLACALPLGFTSQAELLDAWLDHEMEMECLNRDLHGSLPPGIQIEKIIVVTEREPALQVQVQSAVYEITLRERIPDLDRRVVDLLASGSLPRERRGKPYDLRPLIESLERVTDNDEQGQRLMVQLAARASATGRPEELLEDAGIDQERIAVRGQRSERVNQPALRFGILLQRIPLRVEPTRQEVGLLTRFGGLDQAQGIARRNAEPVGREREGAEDCLLRTGLIVFEDDGPLRHWPVCLANIHLALSRFYTDMVRRDKFPAAVDDLYIALFCQLRQAAGQDNGVDLTLQHSCHGSVRCSRGRWVGYHNLPGKFGLEQVFPGFGRLGIRMRCQPILVGGEAQRAHVDAGPVVLGIFIQGLVEQVLHVG